MPGAQIGRSARLQTGQAGGTTNTLGGYDRDNKQAGMVTPSAPGWSDQNIALVANQAYLTRFVTSRSMTIIKIGYGLIIPSGTDDPVDVGIYDAAWNRLASSGATLAKLNGSARVETVNLSASITLAANTVYYSAISANSTATLGQAIFGSAFLSIMWGQTAGLADIVVKAASHPLPASIVTPTFSGNAPILTIRET